MDDQKCVLAATGAETGFPILVLAAVLLLAGVAVVIWNRRKHGKASAGLGAGALLLIGALAFAPSLTPQAANAAEVCPPTATALPMPIPSDEPSEEPTEEPCDPTTSIDAPTGVVVIAQSGQLAHNVTFDATWLAAFIAAGGTFTSATFTGEGSGVVGAYDGTTGEPADERPWTATGTGTSVGAITQVNATTLQITATNPANVFTPLDTNKEAARDALIAELSAEYTPEDGYFISWYDNPEVLTWAFSGTYDDGCGNRVAISFSTSTSYRGGGGGNN